VNDAPQLLSPEGGILPVNSKYLPLTLPQTSCLTAAMTKFHELSTAQLKEALQISEEIASLQEKLHAVLGASEPVMKGGKKRGRPQGKAKRTMSPEARAKIAAAQKARWAKAKG
jgi:hypothetical protein